MALVLFDSNTHGLLRDLFLIFLLDLLIRFVNLGAKVFILINIEFFTILGLLLLLLNLLEINSCDSFFHFLAGYGRLALVRDVLLCSKWLLNIDLERMDFDFLAVLLDILRFLLRDGEVLAWLGRCRAVIFKGLLVLLRDLFWLLVIVLKDGRLFNSERSTNRFAIESLLLNDLIIIILNSILVIFVHW